MTDNEMKGKAGPPQSVRLSEWLGVSAPMRRGFASVRALLRYLSLAEAWRLFGVLVMNTEIAIARSGSAVACSSENCSICLAAVVLAIQSDLNTRESHLPIQGVQREVPLRVGPRPLGCWFHPDSPAIPGLQKAAFHPQAADQHRGARCDLG